MCHKTSAFLVSILLQFTIKLSSSQSSICPDCPSIKVFEKISLGEFIEIRFKKSVSDYFNISESVTELQFTCTSNYPTKWRFHPSPQRFSPIQDWSIYKERIVGNLNDKSTYKYISNVTIMFTNMPQRQYNQAAACHKVMDTDISTNIYLSTNMAHGILQGEIVSGQKLRKNDNKTAGSRYGKNKNCNMILRIDLKSPKVACDNIHNLTTKKHFLIQCLNPDECEGEIQAEVKEDQCPNGIRPHESLVRSCTGKKCESIKINQPGAIICRTGDDDIGTSLAKVIYTTIENPPKLYIDRIEDKIAIHQLLKIESINKTNEVNNLHTFQSLNLTCLASMSEYTRGCQWAFEYESGEISQLGPGNKEDTDLEMRAYRSQISLKCNSTDITKVICYCPIWNSDEWDNVAFPINVIDSEPPQILSLNISNITNSKQGRDTNGKFGLNLICEAIGRPRPEISWLRNGTEYLIKQIFKENQTFIHAMILIEPLSSGLKEQTFTCVARNMLGTVKQNWTVHNNDFVANSNADLLPYLIGIPIALAAIILVFCFYHIWRVRRNEKLIQKLTEDEIDEFRNGDPFSQSQALFYPYNTDFEIPMKQVHFESKVLGDGFFGLVTRGKIGKAPIAIKTVKRTADVAYLKALLDELKIMCYVGKHEHILSLIGACTENIRKREVYLLVEYCSNGNVLKYLQNSRTTFVDHLDTNGKYNCSERLSIVDYQNISVKKLSSKDLVRWAFEIASGMEFLTRKNIIHGDLAARNILLTDTLQSKIGDFGLSKQLYNYSIYVQKLECPLPLKWMAIESLRDLEFSIKSDIWSYGITLYEIFSLGQIPYPGLQWDSCSWQLLLDGYRMERPQFASESIYKTMLKCWNKIPDNRPPFSSLMNYFEEELFRL